MESDAAVFSRGADHDLQALQVKLLALLQRSDTPTIEIQQLQARIGRMEQYQNSIALIVGSNLQTEPSEIELFECPQVAK